MSNQRRIGPFELAEPLSIGSEDVLYRAVRSGSTGQPQEVSIRVARDPTSESAREALRREMDVLRVINSPSVPKVYAHYESEAAFAMTHLRGVTLATILEAQRAGALDLSTGTAIDVAVEIAHVLRHAHGRVGTSGERIVHGHLDPSKIILTDDGEVAVVGFGRTPRDQKPSYTAPEVLTGDAPSAQSDQWSVAALLVEMILGEPLYTGAANIMDGAREGDVSHWLMASCHTNPDLRAPLQTMLALDPGNRFGQGHELLKSLLEAGRRIGGTVNRRSLLARARAFQTTNLVEAPTADLLLEPPSRTAAPDFSWDLDGPSVGLPEPSSPQHPLPPDPFALPRPSDDAPPAPTPVPRILPSEVAGVLLGSLMMLLGITYVFWVI